jgi:hypothetical protein
MLQILENSDFDVTLTVLARNELICISKDAQGNNATCEPRQIRNFDFEVWNDYV